jgi:stress response protein YsnF
MAQTVVGFFDNPSEAQRAVQQLESIGIPRQSIDISSGNANTNVSNSRNTNTDRSDREEENGITRFFKSLFGDNDDEADRYSRVAQNAQSIVTVHAQSEDQAERAADILDDCGAVDVDERAAQYGYERTGYSRDMDRDRNDREDTTIPRIEENLEVGKREVERGSVRVRSRIVERPVEETVRLREEHVRVDRQNVDRPVSGDELSNFQERDIELTERAEVPVVNKEARVVEEVRVTKDVNEREETVRDTVRNTDIDVDKTDEGRRNMDSDELRIQRKNRR